MRFNAAHLSVFLLSSDLVTSLQTYGEAPGRLECGERDDSRYYGKRAFWGGGAHADSKAHTQ